MCTSDLVKFFEEGEYSKIEFAKDGKDGKIWVTCGEWKITLFKNGWVFISPEIGSEEEFQKLYQSLLPHAIKQTIEATKAEALEVMEKLEKLRAKDDELTKMLDTLKSINDGKGEA